MTKDNLFEILVNIYRILDAIVSALIYIDRCVDAVLCEIRSKIRAGKRRVERKTVIGKYLPPCCNSSISNWAQMYAHAVAQQRYEASFNEAYERILREWPRDVKNEILNSEDIKNTKIYNEVNKEKKEKKETVREDYW